MLRKSPLLFIIGSLCFAIACEKNSSDKENPASAPGPAALPLQDPSTPANGQATNPDGSPVAPQGSVPTPTVVTDPNDPSSNPEPLEPGGPVPPNEPTPIDMAPIPPLVAPTELTFKENQFWVFEKKDNKLSFNTPWDAVEGDGIERDIRNIPDYAASCLKLSQQTYAALAKSEAYRAKMLPLLALGATTQLTFLTIVVDNKNERENLRMIDRDAYFWHWTDPSKKPVLTMNIHEKGSWVWEVIAGPGYCLQPNQKELLRYLDYAAKRFAERGVKS